MRLTKKMKSELVLQTLEGKYKSKIGPAIGAVLSALLKEVLSHDKTAKALKVYNTLPEDFKKYVKLTSYLSELNFEGGYLWIDVLIHSEGINSDSKRSMVYKLGFNDYDRLVLQDPIPMDGDSHPIKRIPKKELRALRAIVTEAEQSQDKGSAALYSINTVKQLQEKIPALSKLLDIEQTGTGLDPAQLYDEVNKLVAR